MGDAEFQNAQNVQFSTKKYYKIYKETVKYGPFTEKKNNLTENPPEEVQTLELLVKDFKLMVLNMLNMLKEALEKKN